jgi:hypothetical protein
MANSDTITVYWAPSKFYEGQQNWSMLYQEPKKVWTELYRSKTPYKDGSMFTCPSMKNLFSNIYSVNVAVADTINLPDLETYYNDGSYVDDDNVKMLPNTGGIVSVLFGRPSSVKDHVFMEYNMSWHFFSSEPVVARFTAPYFPPKAPAPGAGLTAGEFDIGRWFRPINLEYMVPFNTEKLVFEEGDPFFYLEFKTDKKIEFKRFTLTNELRVLSEEMVGASSRYGKHVPLYKKYEMAKKSKVVEQVKTQILKNLVE